ncbi:MAG: thioredoxin-disulfide reductase [Candidatus Omnitrophota bacterium]
MYDLIIIGAGPAGLSAGLYAGRARLKTLILEKMAVGGRILLTSLIENFPGTPTRINTEDLVKNMEAQVKGLEVRISQENVLEIDCKQKLVKTNIETHFTKSIIVASGARPRKLGVPGEERLLGKGVSYCATCDAPFFKDKNVVIIGGGNAVAEEAVYLSRFAQSVTIIHRRDTLRASEVLQERLKNNYRVKFSLSKVAQEIIGSAKVEGVKVKEANSEKTQVIPCDGVFIYIGYDPETDFLREKIKLDESGFIITDEDMHTSEPGILACGDCRKKSLYQVVTACADGAIAAEFAYKYISGTAK